MSKPSKMTQALAVMSAITSGGQLDAATEADLRQVLDGAASGANLTKSLDRALSAARSRTWEQVADAALSVGADGAPRSARTHLRQAVAAAAAVRALELRLNGDSDDVQSDTLDRVVADTETDTAAASSDSVVLHAADDTDSGAGWTPATDTEEVA